jgi:hypothetical protein
MFEFDSVPCLLGIKKPAGGFRKLGRGAEEFAAESLCCTALLGVSERASQARDGLGEDRL